MKFRKLLRRDGFFEKYFEIFISRVFYRSHSNFTCFELHRCNLCLYLETYPLDGRKRFAGSSI